VGKLDFGGMKKVPGKGHGLALGLALGRMQGP